MSTTVPTAVTALSVDPTKLALADGALAVSLAQQNPNPANDHRARMTA